MKIKFLFCILLSLCFSGLYSTLLFIENFDYTVNDYLTNNGWVAHSSAGLNPVLLVNPGLSYPSYISSNSGASNAVRISSLGEDLNKGFAPQTSGSVYASFMINASALLSGEYFFHFGETNMNTNFYGKVYAKKDALNNLQLGLTKRASTGVYSTLTYSLNTTVLVVLKYTFNSTSTTDDMVSLFINPANFTTEPIPDLTATDGNDAPSLGTIALRQGTSAAPTLVIDGIRIATNWADLFANLDTPPSINSVTRNILIPYENENTLISATVTDNNSVSSVNLNYTINGGITNTIAMVNNSGTYTTTITSSAYSDSDLLEYWITATDNSAQTSESSHSKVFIGNTNISVLHQVNSDGVSPCLNVPARVTGICTGVFSSTRLYAYLQAGGSAINVNSTSLSISNLTLEHSYTIIGYLKQSNGRIQLEPTDQASITDNGLSVMPQPTVLTIDQILSSPEIYENLLVKIINTNKYKGTWPSNLAPGYFLNDTPQDTLQMYFDTGAALTGTTEPEYPLNVTGIFTQYDSSMPFTAGYEIVPRSYTDFSPGARPHLEFSQPYLNFGSVGLNLTAMKTIMVKNFSGNLTISGISLTNPQVCWYNFQNIPAVFPVTLTPSDSLILNIYFKPDALQNYSDFLTFSSNDYQNPVYNYSVQGTGYTFNANFSLPSYIGDVPFVANFTDTSQGNILSWNWNFDDSISSNLQNPVHTFSEGTYQVTLTVSDTYHTKAVTKTVNAIAHPLIQASTSILDFGVAYVGYTSEDSLIVFQNTGTDTLVIGNIQLKNNDYHFLVNYNPALRTLLPGDTFNIGVCIAPTSVTNYADTLIVYNTSENKPQLKIKLMGRGEYVPPTNPDPVNIALVNENAVIQWSPVTTNIYGMPLTPDAYVVLYSELPGSDLNNYYFLGETQTTQFIHYRVAHYRSQMFYKVLTIKEDLRSNSSFLQFLKHAPKNSKWNTLIQDFKKHM